MEAEFVEVQQQSYLNWMFQALGPLYGLGLPLVALAVFVGACLVVMMARRPAMIAAYLVFLPLPLMIGVFGSLQGFISSMQVLAMASASPKPSEIAAGISMGLFSSFVALLLTFPSYFVLAAGLFLRTLLGRETTADKPLVEE